MEAAEIQLIRGYLDNVQVNLQTVQYTKVTPAWGTTVKNPEVSRLYFIREGEGSISIRNRVYYPQRGQLILLPAGESITFDTHAEHTFGKYWCHFSASVGEIHLFRFIELPHCVDGFDEEQMEQSFQQLISLYQNPSITSPLRIKAVLLSMISLFIELSIEQQHTIRPLATADTNKIQTILEYIEQHLTCQMTIDELAALVHFHPQYLILYFKSMMGVSPIAYINRKRLEKAKQLLTNRVLTIGEIASQLGMEAYYFSRLFKKETGLSPSDYRGLLASADL